MKQVAVIGEILVEIVADTVGDGFLEPIALTGPFPSGAPAIFIDQAARVGQTAAIVSGVGEDDFGKVNLNRLIADGVDVSAVRIDHDRPTGSAFVRYRRNGSRDFVYNIRHSACGTFVQTDAARQVLLKADHFHVMGSSFASPDFRNINLETVRAVKARGGTVSFDPNLRKEILGTPGVEDAMAEMLGLTDLFLPSDDELTLLTRSKEQKLAIAELLSYGIAAIVHKQGARGVAYHSAKRDAFVPAFKVTEIDPTGAGDCFGGAFTSFWLRGMEIVEALTLAAAAGALAVTHRGPMEGAFDLETLRAFVREHEGARS